MTTFEKYMQSEHFGKENAIKSKALESIFNCKGKEIRHMVNELRCLGVPICSCSHGYFYSTDAAEIQETMDHLAGRASRIQAAHDGMKTLLLPGTEYEAPIN
jgi:hypothetical protein